MALASDPRNFRSEVRGVSFAKFHLFVPGYSAEFGFPIALGALKAKNRRPTLGGRLVVPTGELSLPRTRESHPRFILDGTLASPPPGCRVRLRTAPNVDYD